MEISPTVKGFFEMLMRLAIGRCHASGDLCRITVSLKFVHHSTCRPSVKISVSDTGTVCKVHDFFETESSRNWIFSENDWDGELYVTTTCIRDDDIHTYKVCLKETTSQGRVTALNSKPKNGNKFSGSDVTLSVEIDEDAIDGYITWITMFIKKILILKIPMIAFELFAEDVDANGSKHECLIQSAEGVLLPNSMPNVERLASGLQEYVFKHGSTLDKECIYCFPIKEHLKMGYGVASSRENKKGTGYIVDVVISMVDVLHVSCNSCSWTCSSKTEVLCFQDFSLWSDSNTIRSAFKNIDWKKYGLVVTRRIEESGPPIFEWANLSPSVQINIAIHCYRKKYPKLLECNIGQLLVATQKSRTSVDKSLIRKAITTALLDLKTKYDGILLSCHASKVRDYAPDLSKTLASLVLSSNDLDFQAECASILGFQPRDVDVNERMESRIRERLITAIERNDRITDRGKKDSSRLFDFEEFQEKDCYQEDDEGDCALGKEH